MNVQQQISDSGLAMDVGAACDVDAVVTARAAARAAERAAIARTRPLGDADAAAPVGDEDGGCAASAAMLLKKPPTLPKEKQPLPFFPTPDQPYPNYPLGPLFPGGQSK
jgi:hypothetical protein